MTDSGRRVAGPVTTLNDTLADHGLISGFATVFVGRCDAQARALSYVNCGQDAGLLLRAATSWRALTRTQEAARATTSAFWLPSCLG